MASLQVEYYRGRDFTSEELIGRQIRIEGPVSRKPFGYAITVMAGDEMVNNVLKLALTIEPDAVVEARLTLYLGRTAEREVRTEEVILRDNIEVSFSAMVSEVQ